MTPIRMRWVGALSLLAALCLPMSTCTSRLPSDGSGTSSEKSQQRETVSYNFAFSRSDLDDPFPAVVRLLFFVWPTAAAILLYRRARRPGLILVSAEFLLVSASAALIYVMTEWGNRFVGAYVAWAALAIYSLGPTIDVRRRLTA